MPDRVLTASPSLRGDGVSRDLRCLTDAASGSGISRRTGAVPAGVAARMAYSCLPLSRERTGGDRPAPRRAE
ncbi:MAG: hypothetical protein PHV57_09310 [Methanomicrobiaceae archaeon]|nr:hypothetical protein [Methanomicrobiaceae archaeon]